MPTMMPRRREVLAGAAGLLATAARASSAAPRPQGFDPDSVVGLSSRLLTSHYENNYKGAVARLGAIRRELGEVDYAAVPGYRLNGLKREELLAYNSMALHEVYFAGFAPRAEPDSELAQAIEHSFGSLDRWAAQFSAMGKALSGGSGWVILTWDARDGRLTNSWAADHTMTLAGGVPLVALDMYEHAYHLDYGAKAGAYVDAFMRAVSWQYANALFSKGVGSRQPTADDGKPAPKGIGNG